MIYTGKLKIMKNGKAVVIEQRPGPKEPWRSTRPNSGRPVGKTRSQDKLADQ